MSLQRSMEFKDLEQYKVCSTNFVVVSAVVVVGAVVVVVTPVILTGRNRISCLRERAGQLRRERGRGCR